MHNETIMFGFKIHDLEDVSTASWKQGVRVGNVKN